MSVEAIGNKCSPGNECKLAVESATKVAGLEENVKYIRDKIDNIVLGVAGSVILLLLNIVWQFATK